MMKQAILIFLIVLFQISYANDDINPIASPYAEACGIITTFAGDYPKSLNYYLNNSVTASEIFSFMYETLLSISPISLKYEPNIAKRWKIKDNSFIFYLDKNAKWSNGEPITAYDVEWTYNTILDSKNLTGPHKVGLSRFFKPKIVDKYTIEFISKKKHWQNLLTISSFQILPKKVFEKKDFNKINFNFPVVSGPYKLEKIKEGIFLTLKKRYDWWQINKKKNTHIYNFDTIKYKFFTDRNNAFEAFKKGEIDIYPVYTAHIWGKKTNSEKFFKNHIIKQKIFNYNPIGFQGFAMNMRKFPFDDINVRKAMNYLIDRKKMNLNLMHNQYFLHKSYFEDIYTKKEPCTNSPFEFNKKAAILLLKKAGFKHNKTTGLLEKEGKKFSFKFLSRSASSDKFLNIYAEDLKDIGIEMIIEKKDWASWLKDMDEFNYQMTWAAWSSSVFKDPESMWSSKQSDTLGGTNITGFKNKKVDALIEKQKTIFDINKRNKILREIDSIIYKNCPYVLLWNINYIRLLYWNKFGTPETVLSKYGDQSSALVYWWLDKNSLDDLKDAINQKKELMGYKEEVHFQ